MFSGYACVGLYMHIHGHIVRVIFPFFFWALEGIVNTNNIVTTPWNVASMEGPMLLSQINIAIWAIGLRITCVHSM